MELKNPYGYDLPDGYFGAVEIRNIHGEITYVFRKFVNETEYLEWFEENIG